MSTNTIDIPVLPLVTTQPLLRPRYVVTADALASLSAFVTANSAALNRWYDQLRAADPDDFCGRAEFYAVQYDCEVLRHGGHQPCHVNE